MHLYCSMCMEHAVWSQALRNTIPLNADSIRWFNEYPGYSDAQQAKQSFRDHFELQAIDVAICFV